MDLHLALQAALLGLVEGLTEFLPVSSTGHLILLGDLLGFQGPPGKVFEVVIQLGAILAICALYFRRLLRLVLSLPKEPASRRFAATVLLAFLPAAVIGALAHGFIKSVLFTPWVVSTALVLGGAAILAIERSRLMTVWRTSEEIPPSIGLGIGFVQCLAMIPGVSRSGATILGGMLLGCERRAATEFSFFLAIPTMLGATVYDLYKNRETLAFDDAGVIAVGFGVAFVTALFVVRGLLAFVARHDFQPFAWYRIALGFTMMAILALR